MRQAGQITDGEWNYFLRGAAGVERVSKIPYHMQFLSLLYRNILKSLMYLGCH